LGAQPDAEAQLQPLLKADPGEDLRDDIAALLTGRVPVLDEDA